MGKGLSGRIHIPQRKTRTNRINRINRTLRTNRANSQLQLGNVGLKVREGRKGREFPLIQRGFVKQAVLEKRRITVDGIARRGRFRRDQRLQGGVQFGIVDIAVIQNTNENPEEPLTCDNGTKHDGSVNNETA